MTGLVSAKGSVSSSKTSKISFGVLFQTRWKGTEGRGEKRHREETERRMRGKGNQENGGRGGNMEVREKGESEEVRGYGEFK